MQKRTASSRAQRWFSDVQLRGISTGFDDRETGAARTLQAALARALKPDADVILDIGCGGAEMLADVRALAPDVHLIGVDPVPAAIDAAKQRHADDEKMTLLVAAAEQLDACPELVGEHQRPQLAISHLNVGLWDDAEAGLSAALRVMDADSLLFITDVAAAETPAHRESFLSMARTDDERAYLSDQLAAAWAPSDLEQLCRQAAARAGRTVEVAVARGGLAGYPYDSPQARTLYTAPGVARAVTALRSSGTGRSDGVLNALVWVT